MTELQLYKYINDNHIEWHWFETGDEPKCVIMPSYGHLEELSKMISSQLDEEGIEVTMKEGYICIEMNEICEYCDIEIENVFPKEEENQ